jgi:peptide/nickel transport system substrate-binding protein
VDARFRPWLKRHPEPATNYLALDTHEPPFDDRRARQAVNYALDRNKIVQIYGGEDVTQPTCQMLPPNFPAYRPYCPHTLDPGAKGSWAKPDLAKAKRLVAASRTAGTHVRLWVPPPRGGDYGPYVKGVLEDLGYSVTLRSSYPPSARFGKEYKEAKDPIRRYFIRIERGAMSEPQGPQIAFGGWAADYPAASNFIEPMFSCRLKPQNYSRICDPALERKIKRAVKLEQDDPQRASRLWTELDHEITDEALVVPLVNF